MNIPFVKMHGTGNDFVIFDGRQKTVKLTADAVQRVASRRLGVGCDQVIVMEPSSRANMFMRIYNADGSEVQSCGNASRCIGWLLMEESYSNITQIETHSGILECKKAGQMRVCVDMGAPSFDWQDIPLAEECDTQQLDITHGDLTNPAAVSMGNPHMIFVVPDVKAVNLATIGPELETHPLFPERVNVSVVHIENNGAITQRVWERGAGQTLACGTAACAAVVALHKRGLIAEQADVTLPGGTLRIHWDQTSNHVLMTGDVATSFRGEIAL